MKNLDILNKTCYLFSDASVNHKTKSGVGAYLWVFDLNVSAAKLKQEVRIVSFEQTSSTKAELQTLLHALSNIPESCDKIIIYTDSQNTIGLLERREKLEAKNYTSKKNESIKNADLYKQFYALHDQLKFKLIKVRGHKKTNTKDYIDKIFTIVDRASRQAGRDFNNLQ